MDTLYLDTETTGLSPSRGDRIVELAVVDDDGQTVIDTLVNPERAIPWDATRIHGITDEMVAQAPTMEELWPAIEAATTGYHVVIYNAAFDTRFFPGRLANAGRVSCAMLRFAPVFGQRHSIHGGWKWQPLARAVEHVGYVFQGPAHRALADALACRAVWRWLEQDAR